MVNKQKTIPKPQASKVFTCVDCGARFTVKHAPLTMSKNNPKYCKYCTR